VIASLSYEHFNEGDLVIGLDEISPSIYLIHDGQVDVSHKDSKWTLLSYEEGSYIGDTSYIFRILNQYSFKPKQSSSNGLLIYSLKDKYLSDIFDNFPRFESLLKVRALQRHHYIRKLKK
jgi:signal-transduction protein with cAMP-binding, CBS, and nucleotidyltransferase domain